MPWSIPSPRILFSRTPSSASVPVLSPNQTDDCSPAYTGIISPFEQEFGKKDLPGGWFDKDALHARLAETAGQKAKVEHDDQEFGREWERDIRVTQLMIHPIKSCRGIPVEQAVLTPQGLEFDRVWAVRQVKTGLMCTAREFPTMVLIHTEMDFRTNKLRVTFPEKSGLPGFEVKLKPELEEMKSWNKVKTTIMHDKPLPASLLPPTTPLTSTASNSSLTADDQLSQFLKMDVQFIQVSPWLEDKRICEAPPGRPEEVEWNRHLVKKEVDLTTGFADGYPILIANEESYRSVADTVKSSASSTPPTGFEQIGPTFDKSLWNNRDFDQRRFRANIVFGRTRDLPESLSREEGNDVDEKPLRAWEEDAWREIEFGQAGVDGVESIGKLVCTSRCGRCQLPNVCPDTGKPDKAVPFKVIAKYRRVDPAQRFTPIFGVNALSICPEPVTISVGDKVRISARNSWDSLPVTRTGKV